MVSTGAVAGAFVPEGTSMTTGFAGAGAFSSGAFSLLPQETNDVAMAERINNVVTFVFVFISSDVSSMLLANLENFLQRKNTKIIKSEEEAIGTIEAIDTIETIETIESIASIALSLTFLGRSQCRRRDPYRCCGQ